MTDRNNLLLISTVLYTLQLHFIWQLKMRTFSVILVCSLIYSSFAVSINKIKLQDDFSRLLKWEPIVSAESHESSWFKEKVSTKTVESIFHAVGPKTLFAGRLKNHRKAVELLANVLKEQSNVDDVLKLAGILRDHPQINPKLWIQALVSAKIARDDMKLLKMPSMVELIPDDFLPHEIFEQAENLRKQECLVLDENFTNDNGVENDLWYFREDLLLNSHHYLWHTYFSVSSDGPVARQDRRAELFSFMHHEFLARYASERMTLGLRRIEGVKQDMVTPMEGYSSHLSDRNSLRNWAIREPNSTLKDLALQLAPGLWQNFTVADSAALQSLLIADIRKGFLIEANGTSVPLDGLSGIGILADAIESSVWTVNPDRYSPHGLMSGFHNNGHGIIAFVATPVIVDPINSQMGIMASTSTSMRDPIFYRFHTSVENLFLEHKNMLTPYNPTENSEFKLKWDEIRITNVKVIPEEQGGPNELKTLWSYKQFNFSRGLDLFINETSPPVAICSKHLDHIAFDYEIDVETSSTNETEATVRIFMARRYDENMNRFSMDEQRKLFFSLDQFSIKLSPGTNRIVRNSRNSSLTIPFESWVDLEDSDSLSQNCGCGWPHHLLLPRGSATGTSHDIFVMITPGREDTDDSSQNNGECRIAPLWCGVRDKKYPSRFPIGYPFDRRPYSINDTYGVRRVVSNLDEYINGIPNMGTTRIRIQHLETYTRN